MSQLRRETLSPPRSFLDEQGSRPPAPAPRTPHMEQGRGSRAGPAQGPSSGRSVGGGACKAPQGRRLQRTKGGGRRMGAFWALPGRKGNSSHSMEGYREFGESPSSCRVGSLDPGACSPAPARGKGQLRGLSAAPAAGRPGPACKCCCQAARCAPGRRPGRTPGQ